MSLPKSFFIVGHNDQAVHNLFSGLYSFERKAHLEDAELVIFTGGEDVNPDLYLEKPLGNVYFNDNRDSLEVDAYFKAVKLGIPLIGICRGAQFIHVMNGQSLWQDVNGHGIGGNLHAALDLVTGRYVQVTSCHHQMMRVDNVLNPDNPFKVVTLAARASYRKADGVTQHVSKEGNVFKNDIEVLLYPDLNALCYQGHPEYRAHKCLSYFTELMKRYEFLKKDFEVEEIRSRLARKLASESL